MNLSWDYGLWSLVFFHSFIFIIFAFSFTRPKSLTDWRTFGTFSAFVIALFTEMYGFPLTLYLLSGWLGTTIDTSVLFGHDYGHLWYTFLGLSGNPHTNALHWLSNIFIWAGLLFLSATWRYLYQAQTNEKLATEGPYSVVRHPQYVAFTVIMFGFLLQWPTILTVAMFPVLLFRYIRLAKKEEEETREYFGASYDNYAETVPAFIPTFINIKKFFS